MQSPQQVSGRVLGKASGLWAIFAVFLRLGCTSFGGPVAHLAYFREELVLRRRWVSEAEYADLVALCQFLPGPASSKVGFSLGLLRGRGAAGGIAAWLGFTLPSALILFLFALGAAAFSGPAAEGAIHGLKLVAVAVVAQAVWGMARILTPDALRIVLAVVAAVISLQFTGAIGQISAILFGVASGIALCRKGVEVPAMQLDFPVRRREGSIALLLFLGLLLLPLLGGEGAMTALFNAFYRAGAFVFGGGHVLLPLLEAEVVTPGWVSEEAFLAGYGMAQAVPGPLFTFAAYLGAMMEPSTSRLAGAVLALVAVFLPGCLLTYGILPFWNRLRSRPVVQSAMRGANAAVVGILAAALYTPVWTSSVKSGVDLALVAGALWLLFRCKWPAWSIVLLLGTAGAIIASLPL